MRRFITIHNCIAILLAAFTLLSAQAAFGAAAGQCPDCHTMHNSQGGSAVDASGPYRALIKWQCIGCHTGTNDGSNNIPYVTDGGAPTYGDYGTAGNTLAGGSFYWVANGADSKGHNVTGLSASDNATGMTPPGFNETYTDNAGGKINNGAASWSNQLTCAGTRGCHGKHDDAGTPITDDYASIQGAHHGDDSTIDGSTISQSYRFLYGIKGKEDSDWEYQPTASAHNQYYGQDRTSDTDLDKQTISYLCALCHGDFHSGSGSDGTLGADGTDDNTVASPWVRHPTDYDMFNVKAKSDYSGYGGGAGGGYAYEIEVPVASTDVSAVVSTGVLSTAGKGIVTCISCHRAHGSDFADSLRWDYTTCISGQDDAACGCFKCHTTKDAG